MRRKQQAHPRSPELKQALLQRHCWLQRALLRLRQNRL